VRKLAGLVANLPIGCALHRAEDPYGFGAGWGHTESLLATLIEVLDRHDRHYIITHSKRHAAKPKALKVPRPVDVAPKTKRNATGDELAEMVGKLGGAKVPSFKNAYRDERGRLHDRATGRYISEKAAS
jgi:hypothetical protein